MSRIEQYMIARILIAGTHGSSGKTTVALGLCAALRRKMGLRVQPFKKGPDFIDPMWLREAADSTSCRNLDAYFMGSRIPEIFILHAAQADIAVIEGSKGLFDSMDMEGLGSSASLARQLKTPIILVIDTKKMTRGIAPLLVGYLGFEKDLYIAGIVLNRVGGKRHEDKLRAAIARYLPQVEILGVLYRQPELHIDERHLGLIPSCELDKARPIVDAIYEQVVASLNIERILEIARAAPPLSLPDLSVASETKIAEQTTEPIIETMPEAMPEAITKTMVTHNPPPVRIAVAMDRAFGFYYQENLQALEAEGAVLIPFSPLDDVLPPQMDGLYLGGGFPEAFLKEIEANREMRSVLREKIEAGMPTYAECGGLMYLCRSIQWGTEQGAGLGIFTCDAMIGERAQGRGYMKLRTIRATVSTQEKIGYKEGYTLYDAWKIPPDFEFRAHEFHHSQLVNWKHSLPGAYEVLRGSGIDGKMDGLVYKNVLAAYAHLNVYAVSWWASAFVGAIRLYTQDTE